MLSIHRTTSHLKLMTTVQMLARAHHKEEWVWHYLKISGLLSLILSIKKMKAVLTEPE